MSDTSPSEPKETPPEVPVHLTFKNGKQKRSDPFFKIQEEHQRHRMRTAWIVVGAVCITAAVLVGYVLYKNTMEKQAKAERRAEVMSQIKAHLTNADKQSGYAKETSVLKAIRIAQKVYMTECATQPEKIYWHDLIREAADRLNTPDVPPEPGRDFVCFASLGDMAYIPPGTFGMGARSLEEGNAAEYPRHNVTLSKGFWIGKQEITFAQWERAGNPHYFVPNWKGLPLTRYDYPVSGITWNNAQAYCDIINDIERRAHRLPDGYEYRLPTEAEWEYVARAGSETYYPWGDTFTLPERPKFAFANIWDQAASRYIDERVKANDPPPDSAIFVAPVGLYPPNAFGVYDMIGNVYEWCYDWFNPDAYRAAGNDKDPVQTLPVISSYKKRGVYTEEYIREPCRVIRGGGWGSTPKDARCASRDFMPQSIGNSAVGFRIVLGPKINPSPEKTALVVHVDTEIRSDLQENTSSESKRQMPGSKDFPQPEPGLIP